MDIFIEKLDKIIPVRLFGLFSVIAGILGDIIALLMYPLMKYDFMRNAVSALCLGPGGIFFNVGNILSGLFALIFVNYLGRTFNEEQINKKLKRASIICANISCTSFIFLGIFCGSNLIIAYIHGTSAIISWGSGLCYITFYNIFILKDSNYSKLVAYFGFLASFSLALLMVFFFLHLLPALRFLMIVLPLLEWVNTITIIFWYFIIPIYMIHKKI